MNGDATLVPGSNAASLTIVKVGGTIMDDPAALARFLDALALLEGDVILVHGGGVEAQRLAARLGVPQTVVHGRRVTDSETLRIAVMVYAGWINKSVVAGLQARGRNAIGMSGADARCITTSRRPAGDIDFGFVGDVSAGGVDARVLGMLLDAGLIPVLCAVTHDGRGALLNSNADGIASVLAAAFAPLRAVTALFCFDRNGVLGDPANPESVLPALSESEYRRLRDEGIVSDGMLPKLDAAFSALRAGAKSVRVMHASSLAAFATGENTGGTDLVF